MRRKHPQSNFLTITSHLARGQQHNQQTRFHDSGLASMDILDRSRAHGSCSSLGCCHYCRAFDITYTHMHITLLLAVIPQHASGAPVPVAATAANWSMIIMMEHRYAGDGAVPFTPPPLR